MLTVHQANGRTWRVDEAGRDRAVRRLAQLRRLDPHLIDALTDPDNQYPDGKPRVQRLAVQLDRTSDQVRQDLATLRAIVEGNDGPPILRAPKKKPSESHHDARVLRAVQGLGGNATRDAIAQAAKLADAKVGGALGRLVREGKLVGTVAKVPRGPKCQMRRTIVAVAIPAAMV